MKRKIIHIDEEKCTGCGICADACHEGAIEIVDGKAKLMREDFCDGFGDCLPGCPVGAITFEEREAPAYDAAAVQESKLKKAGAHLPNSGIKTQSQAESGPAHEGNMHHPHEGGCPGSRMRHMNRNHTEPAPESGRWMKDGCANVPELTNWPVQIKLAPIHAPYFDGAKLLIAADCTAYAYAAFHKDFIKGKVTLIGCPKLDAVNYAEKLTEIIRQNDIKSVTIVRMEVPCCGGLEYAAKTALQESGKFIPWQVVTIEIDGQILDR